MVPSVKDNTEVPFQAWSQRLPVSRIMVALLVVAGAMALMWAVSVPPWRAPDELQHFSYIEFLSREHALPYPGKAFLYPDVIESQGRTNFLGIMGEEHTPVDPAVRQPNAAAGHPPLYYLLMLPAYWVFSGGSTETQLYGVRVWSVGIFLVLIAVSYRFARLVFPRAPYLQIGVPLLMIFHPQLVFVSSSVMNDSLLVLLFTAFLYQLVVFAQGEVSWKRAAVIGVLMGLGVLTKVSFLLALPLALLTVIAMLVRGRQRRLLLLKALGMMFGISLLVCGWYFLSKYKQTGALQPTGEDLSKGVRYGQVGLWQLLTATRFRADLIASFLGTFSWMSIPLPDAVFFWFRRLSEIAVGGVFFTIMISRWRRLWATARAWILLFFLGVFALFTLSTAYFEVSSGSAQGRYLFPAVFPFWSLFLAGLAGIFPPSWRPRVTAAIVAAAAVFAVWSLMLEFIPRVT